MMLRMLCVVLAATPAALAEKAWIGDIPGCTRAAAASGAPLPIGCANALNLAAMVYDPAAALNRPERADAAAQAVQRYRAGKAAQPASQSATVAR
jgi:type IV pilus biogenesis protein CpaD/CtpE